MSVYIQVCLSRYCLPAFAIVVISRKLRWSRKLSYPHHISFELCCPFYTSFIGFVRHLPKIKVKAFELFRLLFTRTPIAMLSEISLAKPTNPKELPRSSAMLVSTGFFNSRHHHCRLASWSLVFYSCTAAKSAALSCWYAKKHLLHPNNNPISHNTTSLQSQK